MEHGEVGLPWYMLPSPHTTALVEFAGKNGADGVPGQGFGSALPAKLMPVVWIFPPPGVATPFTTMVAPVGMTPSPSVGALFVFCCERKVFIVSNSYAMPNPARTIVVPLPVTSQATPTRGAKLV